MQELEAFFMNLYKNPIFNPKMGTSLPTAAIHPAITERPRKNRVRIKRLAFLNGGCFLASSLPPPHLQLSPQLSIIFITAAYHLS